MMEQVVFFCSRCKAKRGQINNIIGRWRLLFFILVPPGDPGGIGGGAALASSSSSSASFGGGWGVAHDW